MRTSEEAKEISRIFIDEVFNKRNLKHAEEMLADAFVEHSPPPGVMSNDRVAAMAGFQMFLDSSEDLHVEILEQISDGNRVAIRARYSGTDTGGFMPGVRATGKRFDIEGIDAEGHFAEHYGIPDAMTAMGQLGLMGGPPE
jgi:predicted SnoaL-like aldol condensation-catalyzing enzyme